MKLLQKYRQDQRGSIAMYTGIAVLVMFMGLGCAFDISQTASHKSRLNDLADTTALAAAVVAREGTSARAIKAKDHFNENKGLSGSIAVKGDPKIIFDDGAKEVSVTVEAEVKYAMMGMFGFKNPTVKSTAVVNYMIDDVAPLSIAFAFDTSGSMADPAGVAGPSKMSALQGATHDLFEAMMNEAERPDLLENAMSTTFSSYNENLVDSETMADGYDHITDAVDLMIPDGWTNSTNSLQFASDELNAKSTSETDSRWKGYVVFMTDGRNQDGDPANPPLWDAASIALCDQMKANGYEIYTVAFAAPPEGEALLQACASDLGHYFDSQDADDLKSAFVLIGQALGESTIRLKS